MSNHPTITIAMATFNGEAHLVEQLDSLIEQTYPHWQLLIHDDGSTDGTLAILHEYRQRDSRIVILEDGKIGLGATRNFLHLLNHVNTDFCMFCDQDDIWLGEKVSKMVGAISTYDTPVLIYSNSSLFLNGEVINQRAIHIHPSTLRTALFLNGGVQGCAMIFNRALLEQLRPFPQTVAMHDHLFTLGAIAFGKLIYLNEDLSFYRQHEANVTGRQEVGVFRRVLSFFDRSKTVLNRLHFEANQAFYERYGHLLNPSERILFEEYFRYAMEANTVERLLIILKNRFTLGDKIGVLLIKTLLRKPMG